MDDFLTSARTDSYATVADLVFDSVNGARKKCRDACDAVDKCQAFYFQGRSHDKERNVCNLYSACEATEPNGAAGSLYTPYDGDAGCCKPLTVCTGEQFENKSSPTDGTATSDRQCQAYKDSCPDGQWLDFGSPTTDRACEDYTTSCTESFYLDKSTESSTTDAACLPKKPRGGACASGDVCASGNCVGGACACKEGHYCPKAALPDYPARVGFGVTCASGDQCGSGNCNQGVCCNKDLGDANCASCDTGNGWCSECKPGYSWQTIGGNTGCHATQK
jgi:hypothetical protein